MEVNSKEVKNDLVEPLTLELLVNFEQIHYAIKSYIGLAFSM